jgi:WD40 repeat protein
MRVALPKEAAELVYSTDGSRIAIASLDGTVYLFDAAEGTPQLVLRGHESGVSGVAFSPDGSQLVFASPEGLVRVWALDLDELIQITHSELTRGLTDEECRQYLHKPQGCA